VAYIYEEKLKMKISITVYDERYKKIFSVNKADLQKGMHHLSSFVNAKLGIPLKVVDINKNVNKCRVCGRTIKKGDGMIYEGKKIHQACLVTARQRLP